MNAKKALESVLKDYEEAKFLAERDLSGQPRATLNSATMAKNQALIRLPQLFDKYHNLLMQSTTCLLVYGNNDQYGDFINQLSTVLKDQPFFTDSTTSLYEFLAPRVEENMTADREFNVHSLMILVSEMAVLGKELGKVFIFEPKLDTVKITPNHESVVLAIRDAVMVNSKHELMLDYIGNALTKNALNTKHALNHTFFVLRCLNESEADDLSTSKSIPIDLSAASDYTKMLKELIKTQKGA